MVKRFGLVLAGVVLGGLVALQLPSAAQDASADTPAGRTVTVTGTATISAKPDEAVISLGVHTEAASAQEAMDQNAAKMNAVFEALKALGLTDADIETTGLELYPRWDNRGETILGYRAENRIDVTIHDLGTVGKVIDTAVAAGANLSNGITFRVSDDNAGLDDALARRSRTLARRPTRWPEPRTRRWVRSSRSTSRGTVAARRSTTRRCSSTRSTRRRPSTRVRSRPT